MPNCRCTEKTIYKIQSLYWIKTKIVEVINYSYWSSELLKFKFEKQLKYPITIQLLNLIHLYYQLYKIHYLFQSALGT